MGHDLSLELIFVFLVSFFIPFSFFAVHDIRGTKGKNISKRKRKIFTHKQNRIDKFSIGQGGINTTLQPFRERRTALASQPDLVADVISDGAKRAQVIAQETLGQVKYNMGLIHPPRK